MSPQSRVRLLFPLLCALSLTAAHAAESTNEPSRAFEHFIKARAAELRAGDKAPATLAAWTQQRTVLRENLRRAWGAWPQSPAPLNPQSHGVLQRDGYRIEKVTFQTLPGVRMTANAYVPAQPGRLPTVLCVHGHWRGAKQDPVVQSRCIGLAKLGYFVLVVDAFGAGERAVGKGLGEYHGEMTAATLFPVGLPLSGLQVYENMRAVDYLLTRPEVDGTRLGITGASGGGNQTMYAGAFDERFKAVVPVCSVGNYQAYLGTACCMCEVVPGALRFTEEWGLLAMVAPRALMVISATKDSPQFSVAEAKKSLALAAPVFALHGQPANVRHTTFESPHAYSQPMREAMYGWMAKHLKGEGDGSPVPEPKFETEDPETLRCYPGQTRPDDWMTIPKFAAAEGLKQLKATPAPTSATAWESRAKAARTVLETQILGVNLLAVEQRNSAGSAWVPGPASAGKPRGTVLLLDLDSPNQSVTSPLAKALREANYQVHSVRLRAVGAEAVPNDKIGRAPDHNSAQWSLWLGRSILSQWTYDIRAAIDQAAQARQLLPVTIVANGPTGLAAMCAAALDPRIKRVVAANSLASFLTEVPYEGQRLGLLAANIVRDVGDVPQLAALIAPRQLIIAGAVTGGGKPLDAAALREQFAFTQRVYELQKSNAALTLLPAASTEAIVQALK